MRALKTILIFAVFIFVAGGLVGGYLIFLRPLTLPVYHMAERPADGSGISATTLTIGNKVYISGANEFALEMTSTQGNRSAMIGRTQDGMDVYAIPGQDAGNYIMLTTFMFPNAIFRNASIAPVQLGSFPVDEIQLVENQMPKAPFYSTTEAAIRTEVVDRLMQRKNITKNAAPFKTVYLRLISRQLPGLCYFVYAAQAHDGSVFLAEKLAPEDWIPAGEAFTRWFHQMQPRLR